jgi:hypothetical protein
MYRRREQDASPKVGAPLELARSVQAPIAVVMMRLNSTRRKGRAA